MVGSKVTSAGRAEGPQDGFVGIALWKWDMVVGGEGEGKQPSRQRSNKEALI